MKLTNNDLINKTRESIAFTNGYKSQGFSHPNRNFESNPMNEDTFERGDDDDLEADLAADHKRIM